MSAIPAVAHPRTPLHHYLENWADSHPTAAKVIRISAWIVAIGLFLAIPCTIPLCGVAVEIALSIAMLTALAVALLFPRPKGAPQPQATTAATTTTHTAPLRYQPGIVPVNFQSLPAATTTTPTAPFRYQP